MCILHCITPRGWTECILPIHYYALHCINPRGWIECILPIYYVLVWIKPHDWFEFILPNYVTLCNWVWSILLVGRQQAGVMLDGGCRPITQPWVENPTCVMPREACCRHVLYKVVESMADLPSQGSLEIRAELRCRVPRNRLYTCVYYIYSSWYQCMGDETCTNV